MLLILLSIQTVLQGPVLSETTLVPPQNIHVDKWLLTWTQGEEAALGDVTYTVEYRSFDTKVWEVVPDCVHTSVNSCNVSLTKAAGKEDCVMLRVQAERRGLKSRPVKACSRHGDTCTPEVSLTARPGSLTIHLSKNHTMALEEGDLVKHRIYYGKEGEPLKKYKDAASSVLIPDLEEGQRYCTKVQYVKFHEPVGLESCTQCEVIPKSSLEPKETAVIAVVTVGVLIIMIPAISYILIFHRRRIKQCLRPPYEIPDHFHLVAFPEHHIPSSTSSPSEEHWDVVSCITTA